MIPSDRPGRSTTTSLADSASRPAARGACTVRSAPWSATPSSSNGAAVRFGCCACPTSRTHPRSSTGRCWQRRRRYIACPRPTRTRPSLHPNTRSRSPRIRRTSSAQRSPGCRRNWQLSGWREPRRTSTERPPKPPTRWNTGRAIPTRRPSLRPSNTHPNTPTGSLLSTKPTTSACASSTGTTTSTGTPASPS